MIGIPFRAVSVFVDVRDSTTLTNQLGVATMATLITDFFEGVAIQVELHDGQVCDLNGDGALTVFRGQDAPDRALRAAIGIQRIATQISVPAIEPGRYATSTSNALLTGIGIDQGDICRVVVPGGAGSRESWVGANTAAKLARLAAPPRPIIVTREAFCEMSDIWPCGPGTQAVESIVLIGGRARTIRAIAFEPDQIPC
jgi:class 3 adenylate cyclase